MFHHLSARGKACGQDGKLVNFLVSKTGGIWEPECECVISDKSVYAGETCCGLSFIEIDCPEDCCE